MMKVREKRTSVRMTQGEALGYPHSRKNHRVCRAGLVSSAPAMHATTSAPYAPEIRLVRSTASEQVWCSSIKGPSVSA